MNDLPRQKLKEIIIQHGHALCDDPKRCEAFLRDYCGEYGREIFILISVLKQGIVKDLLNSNNIPIELLLGRLTKQMQNNLGLTEEAARYGVESWAVVLDKMTLQPIETKSATLRNKMRTFSFEVVSSNKEGKILNKKSVSANYFVEDLGNGIILEMIEIPGGIFMMGSQENEKDRNINEGPLHQVKISSFFMGKYLITQEQYYAIIGNNPSNFRGNKNPVEEVSWQNAVKFCQKLSQRTGKIYTLPSEAQWEYACRSKTITPFYFGDNITTDLVNYNGNYPYGLASKEQWRKKTTEVGTFPPNAFGLYDMSGNLWEWCLDTWHNNYQGAPSDGSPWFSNSMIPRHVLRGGSWFNSAKDCRSASRNCNFDHGNDYGFRVVTAPLLWN
ncbi:formylglycine-generating enzyme family protein [Cylindrospermopsis raciborskii]|nr:formylglycine-generating enzyme family protein [Cylindrospermopsis raciborskii]